MKSLFNYVDEKYLQIISRFVRGNIYEKIVVSLFLAHILLFTACSAGPSEEIEVPEETEENVVKSTDEIELKKHVEDGIKRKIKEAQSDPKVQKASAKFGAN